MTSPLEQMFTDIASAQIAAQEARRTLIVPADDVQRATAEVERAGLGSLVTVKAGAHLPPDTWLLFDEQALTADLAESLQGMSRTLFEWP